MAVVRTKALLTRASAPVVGDAVSPAPDEEATAFLRAYQAGIAGGATAAEVRFGGSLDGKHWVELATMFLTASTPAQGFSSAVPWRWVRAELVSIAGGYADATVGY